MCIFYMCQVVHDPFPKSWFSCLFAPPPPEAALAADWKWGCGGRSPPPGPTPATGSKSVAIHLLPTGKVKIVIFKILPY